MQRRFFPEERLPSLDAGSMFPLYHDRRAWEGIDPLLRQRRIGMAEQWAEHAFECIPVMNYLDYHRSGDRTAFEDRYTQRRTALLALVIAECLEGCGRFFPPIVNLAWMICEESTWVLPAHLNCDNTIPQGHIRLLPDVGAVGYFDIFSAATAAILAWTLYFLHAEIERVSPEIINRIRHEILERIIKPFENNKEMHWMGSQSQAVNNWNPWILSNCLSVFLILKGNGDRQRKLVADTMPMIERFIALYPADGGCDEGPGYWREAAGSMFDYLEQLFFATSGSVSIYQEPLIRNMGEYIVKMHISGDQYVNFADNAPRLRLPAELLYQYGLRTASNRLCSFALSQLDQDIDLNSPGGNAYRAFRELFVYTSMVNTRKQEHVWLNNYLTDLQVLTARDDSGMVFIACKGGHNDESHSHNDVGQVILYYNGQPVLIDPGVESYTARTFSDDRYDIWTMQSYWHNLPELDGQCQQAGRQYTAENVSYIQRDDVFLFSLDINAYKAGSNVAGHHREIELNRRSGKVVLSDAVEFNRMAQSIVYYFIVANRPYTTNLGVFIPLGGNDGEMLLTVDSKEYRIAVEEKVLEDRKIREDWKRNALYRISFYRIMPVKSHRAIFTIVHQ